jgi:hypothetical protein
MLAFNQEDDCFGSFSSSNVILFQNYWGLLVRVSCFVKPIWANPREDASPNKQSGYYLSFFKPLISICLAAQNQIIVSKKNTIKTGNMKKYISARVISVVIVA